MDEERPAIIAMQGDGLTGKTAVANILAKSLHCPVIDFDDILEVLCQGQPETDPLIMTQAFNLITPIVKTQVSLGFSVIVDSPLSRRSDLDSLVCLFTELRQKMVALSLIIVECKPDIEKIRWLRLGDDRHSSRWYRQCQANSMRDFSDDDIQPCVSKLVVDTTDLTRPDLLVKAVRDLILTTKGRRVDFKEWRLMHSDGPLMQQADQRRQDSKGFCRDGHCVNLYIEEGISHYVICAVCGIRVTKSGGGVYTCRFCSLAIHKSCGELASKEAHVLENIRKFLRENMGISYLIPEKHLCLRCRLEGKDFSFDCASCIFHSHLRSQLAPTILNKFYKHEHILFLWVRPNMTGQYKCAACKKPGYSIAYGCIEGCNINYHLECALLPA